MKTFSQQTNALLLYSVILTVLGYFIFPLWAVMLVAWFTLAVVVKLKGLDNQFSDKQQQAYWLIVFLYPLLETVLKYMIVKNVIAYSWFWLNRLEHFSWAVAMGLVLIPFFFSSLRKLSILMQLLLYVGAVVIVGNLNEFFEYIVRVYIGTTANQAKMAAYYWDTIYDLAINMAGATFSYLLYSQFFKENRLSK